MIGNQMCIHLELLFGRCWRGKSFGREYQMMKLNSMFEVVIELVFFYLFFFFWLIFINQKYSHQSLKPKIIQQLFC